MKKEHTVISENEQIQNCFQDFFSPPPTPTHRGPFLVLIELVTVFLLTFMFWFFHLEVCGIQLAGQGLNPHMLGVFQESYSKKCSLWSFPGGSGDRNPLAKAGDMGLIPGPGRSRMPWNA